MVATEEAVGRLTARFEMSKPDVGIDWEGCSPWCMKLEEYAQRTGYETDDDGDPSDW